MEYIAISTLLVDSNEGCSKSFVQTAGEDAAQFLYEPKLSFEMTVINSIIFVSSCLQFFFSSLLVSSSNICLEQF